MEKNVAILDWEHELNVFFRGMGTFLCIGGILNRVSGIDCLVARTFRLSVAFPD